MEKHSPRYREMAEHTDTLFSRNTLKEGFAEVQGVDLSCCFFFLLLAQEETLNLDSVKKRVCVCLTV